MRSEQHVQPLDRRSQRHSHLLLLWPALHSLCAQPRFELGPAELAEHLPALLSLTPLDGIYDVRDPVPSRFLPPTSTPAHASAEPRSGGPPPASDLEVAQRLLLQHLLATPQGAPTSASNGLDQAGGAGGTPPGGGRGSARAMLASQLLQELLASAERDSGAVATAGVRSALLLECRQLQLGGRQAPTGKAVAVSGKTLQGRRHGVAHVWTRISPVRACPPAVFDDRPCRLV